MNLTIMPVTEAGCKSIKITGLEVYEVQEQAKVNCADRNQLPEDLAKRGQDGALWEYWES